MILSLFPSLFTYQLVGIFLIRLALGLTFLRLGYRLIMIIQLREPLASKATGVVAIIIGLFLIIGLFTQAAALLAALIMILVVVIKVRSGKTTNLNYYLLVLVVALAILTLGPGAFAIDLPL